jgi:signal transduction histidine kinase/ActR/RegA family two-component response regulator
MARLQWPIIRLNLQSEADVVLARQRARQVGALLEMDGVTLTRLATAVSEIARNALVHGGGGRIDITLHSAPPQLVIRIADRGPGFAASTPDSPGDDRAGFSLGSRRGGGLTVARRLASTFDIETSSRGTTVTLGMNLPPGVSAGPREATAVADALARRPPESLLEELHRQNHEMLGVLESLLNRQDELLRLNEELEETNRGVLALHDELTRELEETNRGVVALYGELDDRSEQLRRTNNLKDQFISYLSHEFRTPVHSIIALAQILLEAPDDVLSPEQQTQVRLIRRSSGSLLDLVDDLLDLAKISAGRLTITPEVFLASEVFGTLRAMMRPLISGEDVALVFDDPRDVQPLYTDQGKLSQILRNLVSNALKFTSEGEVRVSARMEAADRVVFTVADTGIGISPGDHERIFQDYQQVEGPFQRQRKGTGLGLPLSRRLAELLGGRITLESAAGAGSTFRVHLPIRFAGAAAAPDPGRPAAAGSSGEAHILVVDDDEAARYVLRHLLESLGCSVSEAASGLDALRLAGEIQPGAMFVDLVMPGMDGFELVQRLSADARTRDIPVVVRTGKRLTDADRNALRPHVADILGKDDGTDDPARAALRVGAALARLGIAPQQPDTPAGDGPPGA